jgi:sugar-specific transcriptional regulator TrmB
MVRETLKKLGLSEEEISIYLFLLQKGATKATTVARALANARTTTYRFLDSLHEKGLISSAIENGTTMYTAVHPTHILELLDEKKSEVEQILPELLKITSLAAEETKVELYRGVEGTKTVMREIARVKKPYTIFGEIDTFFQKAPVFCYQWAKAVEANKMKGRILCARQKPFYVTPYEDIRFAPKELISNITTGTYGDVTAQFIWSDPIYVIVIRSAAVTKSAEDVFNHVWGGAEQLTKEELKQFRTKPSSF